MPYCRVFPGMRFRLSSRVFRCPAPQCRTTRQLAYSFTQVAPLCFTGCFMMLPLASTLHPWVPPPSSPMSLHLAPLGSSTFLPDVAPPCTPGSLHLPPRSSSTFLPAVFHGLFHDVPVGLHLPPRGSSTLHPGVPPPSSPGSLHLAPLGPSTFLPGVPPPSSPCPSMWTANCPVVLVVTCGNEPNRRL